MRRLAIFFLLILSAFTASAAAQSPGRHPPDTTVSILTFGPGREVYERFGHIAIRIQIPSREFDAAYDWGRFDFDQPGFISNFIFGKMLYAMGAARTQAVLDFYVRRLDRTVVEQQLNLSPEQTQRLIDHVVAQDTDANREYRYDYFRDNCATRIRDAIDVAVDGQLRSQSLGLTGTSYRSHSRRLTPVGLSNRALLLGMDAIIGQPSDKELIAWDAMFVPMELSKHLDTIALSQGKPLVAARVVLNQTRTPANAEPTAQPWLWQSSAAIGLLLAGATGLVRRRAILFRTLAVAWSLFAAACGGILIFVGGFTDHWAMQWNQNLLILSPLSLLLALLLLRRSWLAAASRLAGVIVGLSVLAIAAKLLPVGIQNNFPTLWLVVPMHCVIWLGLKYGRNLRWVNG